MWWRDIMVYLDLHLDMGDFILKQTDVYETVNNVNSDFKTF